MSTSEQSALSIVSHCKFLLLIACASCLILLQQASIGATATSYDSNAPIELYYQTSDGELENFADQVQNREQQKRQTNGENSLSRQDNLRRYLFKDLNIDGYSLNAPAERRRWMRLRELLDSLDVKPIYRSGRTAGLHATPSDINLMYDGNSIQDNSIRSQFNRYLGKDLERQKSFKEQQQQQKANKFAGISFPSLKASSSALSTINGALVGSKASSNTSKQQPRRLGGSDEVAYNAPIHGLSDLDGYKRVENTRWNNLRGMWGKR